MKKLRDIIGLLPVKGMFGIEIEAEGKNIQEFYSDTWNMVDDNSLRGVYPHSRCEFVLRNPVLFEDVEKALVELKTLEKPAKFDFSFRTSTHVHLNVQECNSTEILNIVYTYLLLEEVMIKFCGPERVANRFCLRLQDADGMMQSLILAFSEGIDRNTVGVFNNDIRYSSLNLASLTKYGSVEFRGMRGTLDTKVLMTWIGAINNLNTYALSKKNPLEIYNDFADHPYKEFVQKVLGDEYKSFLYDGFERDMSQSFSLTIDLPHMFNLYNQKHKEILEQPPERPKKVKKVIGLEPINREDFLNAVAQVDMNPNWVVNPMPVMMNGWAAPPPRRKIVPAPIAIDPIGVDEFPEEFPDLDDLVEEEDE